MVNGIADGETRKSGGEKRRCLPQELCPLGAHSSNGEIWGHGQGGMPIFFSDQGPLLKGGGDVGGEYLCERVFDFFCSYAIMFGGRGVFTCNEAYKL